MSEENGEKSAVFFPVRVCGCACVHRSRCVGRLVFWVGEMTVIITGCDSSRLCVRSTRGISPVYHSHPGQRERVVTPQAANKRKNPEICHAAFMPCHAGRQSDINLPVPAIWQAVQYEILRFSTAYTNNAYSCCASIVSPVQVIAGGCALPCAGQQFQVILVGG